MTAYPLYQSDFTLQIASVSKIYEITVNLVDHDVYQSDSWTFEKLGICNLKSD